MNIKNILQIHFHLHKAIIQQITTMSAYALPGVFPFESSSKLRPKSKEGSYQSKANNRTNGGIDITIESAKINPHLLIQSLTRQTSHTRIHIEQLASTLECKHDDDDDEQWGEYSEAQNTFQDRRIHAVVPEGAMNGGEREGSRISEQQTSFRNASISSKEEPHMNAIEFTLSICSNGRSYTAKRPFKSLSKLREELVNEVTSRCSGLEIPELPSLREKLSTNGPHNVAMMNGFAGRGFSNLQAMVCSYRPKVEDWLHVIVDLNPCSQSLANFLWEPIAINSNKKRTSMKSKQERKCSLSRKNQMTTLDSINEE